MKQLNRQDILNKQDLPKEEIEIPEWEGSVCVRGMTGYERDRWEQMVTNRKGANVSLNLDNARAKLVAMCTTDEDGKRLFTEDDVNALSEKNASALNRIAEVALRLSGFTTGEVQRLQDNLKNAPKEGSISS